MNGFLEGYFQAKEGLSQGETVSPCLFLLVMEAFSCLLQHDIHNSNFQFHPRFESLQVSRLLRRIFVFACCCQNGVCMLLCLKATLDEFSQMSGLCPNVRKSSVFFAGASEEVNRETCAA